MIPDKKYHNMSEDIIQIKHFIPQFGILQNSTITRTFSIDGHDYEHDCLRF